MGIAFRVLWTALKDYYEEMFRLVGANLLWCLLALPIVTLPPATAGIFYLTNQVTHHKSVEFAMFFEGFKKYLVKSYLLALLDVAVLIICYTNITFYGAQVGGQWGAVLQGLFLGLGALWCLIQLYAFPMLFEQQEPRLLLALRNATFMALASPLTTLTLGVLLAIVIALSAVLALPLAVATMAIVALAANGAVLTLLVRFGIRKPPEDVVEA